MADSTIISCSRSLPTIMLLPNVVPIPGSKNKERIVDNLNALQVELTDAELAALENALNQHKVYGHRGFGGF